MACEICGCDTGGRWRHHSTPDGCADAIRREKADLFKRIAWLDERLELVRTSDRIETLNQRKAR